MDKSIELFVHIGQPKIGSSTIQRFLNPKLSDLLKKK